VDRKATAEGCLILRHTTVEAIRKRTIRKGDPFGVGEAAALLAVKSTPSLIPHCHPIPITSVSVHFRIEESKVICTCEVRARYSTGVEMEALTGVSVGLLTVWDMVKYLEKDDNGQYPEAEIRSIKVLEKRKGHSQTTDPNANQGADHGL
jgi:cyclic pyranopterin monophosphate synthase